MRFAYIDSQGNEVSIPSVDALALRIELGAIGPDTELYDAQADHWGPAHTHEIFHTLQRQREEGFVAPPPPVIKPASQEVPADEGARPGEEASAADGALDEVTELEALAPDGALDEVTEPEALAPDASPAGEGGEDAEEMSEPAVGAGGGADILAGLDLSVAPDEGSAPRAAEPPAPEPPTGELPAADAEPREAEAEEAREAAEDTGFDFGGFGELELEASPFEEEPAGHSAETEPDSGQKGGGPGAVPGGGQEAEVFGDLASEFDLEQPLSDLGFGGDALGGEDLGERMPGGGLEMERPMSDFSADAPPSWMEEEGPEAAEEPAPPPPEATPPSAPEPEAAPPRATTVRRAPPRRKPTKRSPVPAILGVMGLVVVGAGAWLGYSTLRAREEANPGQAAFEEPPVTIPEIPAELLPRMRDVGEQALSDMVEEFQSIEAEYDLPPQIDDAWLGGHYLANASQYPGVPAYWEGIERFVARVKESDAVVFDEKYQARLVAAGIAADTAALLLARADSGFKATRPQRRRAYQLMDDLTSAALDLHDFLLQNEAEIAYEPAAAGMSRDPVLEAVPSTRSLKSEMWDMVDRITSALQALGTLDRVTTQRLTAVLFDRIRSAGFE